MDAPQTEKRKKYSRGFRKYLREQKALLRRTIKDPKAAEDAVRELQARSSAA